MQPYDETPRRRRLTSIRRRRCSLTATRRSSSVQAAADGQLACRCRASDMVAYTRRTDARRRLARIR
jgi:hypothetical protein